MAIFTGDVITEQLASCFLKIYGDIGTAIISVSDSYNNVCVLSFDEDAVLLSVREEFPDHPVYFKADAERADSDFCREITQDEQEGTLWWNMPKVKVYRLVK